MLWQPHYTVCWLTLCVTYIKLLFTSSLAISCVHTGYLSAVTIPAGARSIVIKEDPVNADNFFGRSPL